MVNVLQTRNGGYGYSSFMTYSDIVNTRSFLKHDSVVISVEVKGRQFYLFNYFAQTFVR